MKTQQQLKGLALGVMMALGSLAIDGMIQPVQAQSMARDISVIVPRNPDATVNLSLIVEKLEYSIGEYATFKFRASESGYVSLWDFGTSGKVTRIFPNEYSGRESARVQAGREYTAGVGDTYRFQVSGPTGTEAVYAVWTRDADAQPASLSELQPLVGTLTRDLRVVRAEPATDWVTEKVNFRINEPGRSGPVVSEVSVDGRFTLPGNGTLYGVVMGADVGELSYTNHDAQAFGETLRNMAPRSRTDIRILENATVDQFQREMQRLRQVVGPNDTVVVFFSGHGSTVADDNGDEADGLDEIFIMYDVQIGLQNGQGFREDFVVRDDTYREWVSELDTDNVLTVIDACHSGGLFKSFTTGYRAKLFVGHGYGQDRANRRGGSNAFTTKNWDTPKGLLYAAAKEDEQALEDPTRGGGAFTLEFLAQVEQARGGDSLQAIFDRTSRKVVSETNRMQTPVAEGDREIGEKIELSSR